MQRPRYVIATHYDDVVPRFLHFYRTSVACLLRIQTGLLQHISIATRDICITQYAQFEHLTDIRFTAIIVYVTGHLPTAHLPLVRASVVRLQLPRLGKLRLGLGFRVSVYN